ncbi:MAG TPA: response regulator transcription factor [Pseudonocardiaceae bacterium]|nr:response regulator transcription factor [Pseudonocardiaceae bacterium]
MADPREPDDRIRVLVVDDHPAVRRGLRMFLETYSDMIVIGEAADGAEALRLVAAESPDVVLLDLMMPEMDGIAVLTALAERGLTTRVLVVTSFVDRSNVLPAIRAGARGYVYKDVDPQALAAAVRSVRAGHVLLEPEIADTLFAGPDVGSGGRDPAAESALTARERDVLRLIASGGSNREIARTLVVSEKTVKTHVSNILLKLGLADRTQAALFAVRHGLAGEPAVD